MAKGEIARFAEASESVYMRERVKSLYLKIIMRNGPINIQSIAVKYFCGNSPLTKTNDKNWMCRMFEKQTQIPDFFQLS